MIVKSRVIEDKIPLSEVLGALNFPVELRPVSFMEEQMAGGQGVSYTSIPEYRAVVRAPFTVRNRKGIPKQGNRVLGMVSSGYNLLKHGDVMQTNLEMLQEQNWKIAAYKLDKGGAKAYVVMVLSFKEQVLKNLGIRSLHPRLMMKNAYDGTGALKLSTGLFDSEHQSYLVHPLCEAEISIRHYGDQKDRIRQWPHIYKKIEQLMPQFEQSIESFKSWIHLPISSQLAQVIADRAAGKRNSGTILTWWESNGKTAWALYSAGAKYLTTVFKGAFQESERRNWQLYTDIQDVLNGKPLKIKETLD